MLEWNGTIAQSHKLSIECIWLSCVMFVCLHLQAIDVTSESPRRFGHLVGESKRANDSQAKAARERR
jgi:hypothetical protein